ncbi:MAG: hypothetical protein SFU55_04805 [Methylophilus sp.]|nr:hypothetical protein [Methylophilus sp.]
MINDYKIAIDVLNVLDECSEKINETIRLVQNQCSQEEFEAYRNAAGFVMGYIYTEIVAPLHHKHPSLEPDELRD